MKVLFLTNIPSPYRVAFFNELGKLCDLTVLFEKNASDERDESWKKYNFQNFKGIILKGKTIRTDTAFCPEVTKYVGDRSYDEIICTNIASPTGMLAIEYMKLKGIPYWIEGDGGFAKSGRGLKERLKRHFISGAKGYFSTSAEHDKYYLTYGADKDKIYRYPFTSLYAKDILKKVPTAEEKNIIRRQLGIKEGAVVVTVGQFIHRKGFDVLLNAAGMLSREIGFYFIGGTPTDEYLEITKRLGLCKNVHFLGFCSKAELSEYFKAADLFVLPTREDIWGLVINEALAHGLPVVSTERCIAAQELVRDNENGYIVPVGNDLILAEKIGCLIESPIERAQFARKSKNMIHAYTFENMALKHMEIL